MSQKTPSRLIFDAVRLNEECIKNNRKLKGPELQKKLKLSEHATWKLIYILDNIENIKQAFKISSDLRERKISSNLQYERDKIYHLTKEIEELQLQNNFLLAIQDSDTIPELKYTESIISEAVAMAVLSDIHSEEKVDGETIYGLNDYNLEICEARVSKWTENLLKQIRKERQNIDINKLVLGLLGDNITGYIHEELKENNLLSPTEATMFIKKLLMASIKKISEDSDCDEISISCTKGNHGRTTTKKRFATAYQNSFEWMMYHDMANTFQIIGGFNNIRFDIPKAELAYVKVGDRNIRFGHGDHFNFIGGVGGVAIPLMKWLYRINGQIKADMTFIGHWHQMLRPAHNCLMNGSIIGYNAYAAAMAAHAEPPMQQFILLDKKRGFTVNTPILCT